VGISEQPEHENTENTSEKTVTMPSEFEPTREAALARLEAVKPEDYARTRNHLDGAVTRLSPYITHGLLTETEVLQWLLDLGPLPVQHPLVYQLGWRAWFRHRWQELGYGILTSIHPGPLPDSAYSQVMPADVLEGRTGIPVVDQAVGQLNSRGWLHNHARLWLASALVHGRKLHWRTCADWMLSRLLDGDLASNHLSWQWVAGTGSHRPYLASAANVARFAPPEWHSPDTPLDRPLEELRLHAASHAAWPAGPPDAKGEPGPTPQSHPPAGYGTIAPDAALVAGRDVWLVHPFRLGPLPEDLPQSSCVIGVLLADWHRMWPWVPARWDFVLRRMQALTPHRWSGSADAIGKALAAARSVRTTGDPHLDPWLKRWAVVIPPASPFPRIDESFRSFSQWWNRITRGLRDASELRISHQSHSGEKR
jgi:deoxyribodipyrimidine photo-lyase